MQPESGSEKTCGSRQPTATHTATLPDPRHKTQAIKRQAIRKRVLEWLCQVTDQPCLPLGEFPHQTPITTVKRICTSEQFGDISGRYQLELSDKGHYVQTRPIGKPRAMARGVRSELSERWLESRGYLGGASD
jgi:hypothetical protein